MLTKRLPEVQGWLLLRRAGLTAEQKSLVMSQAGKGLTFDSVASNRQTTFGQESLPKPAMAEKAITYQDEEEYGDDAFYGDEDPGDQDRDKDQWDQYWNQLDEEEDAYYGEDQVDTSPGRRVRS